ncbi:hypothetical protein PTSG_09354 [Salpingoeca rosetta]|uniref:Exocyst complex component n=1 Tax=Salpingoeca rosetta (strain ATCC 50818 / BSB-021) TaxID=946362 RepID=F2UMD9_SALR5|nr:uncharacterized protein PTSG_09354 [Salpingoeca rosetta]EGD78288.1 hypothetical protein PTSG_09354 [Salpingoeca rosetta]|eukprot:XP_004989611.1 hypothetical protein PTSG_09354 [Salpingoeca rosetta]
MMDNDDGEGGGSSRREDTASTDTVHGDGAVHDEGAATRKSSAGSVGSLAAGDDGNMGHGRNYSMLLSEVINSEGNIAPTLRAVYDSSQSDIPTFVKALETQTTKLDGDIERLCSTHYQGFIDSIDRLLKLKDHALKLQTRIDRVKGLISDAGTGLQAMTESLARERRRQCNILRTIETLNVCVPALRLFCKVQVQLQAGRFYSVIKTLEELEAQHLAHVTQFRFGQAIQARIPHIRAQVRQEAFGDMRRFLEEARMKAKAVGETAMARAQKVHAIDTEGMDPDAAVGAQPSASSASLAALEDMTAHAAALDVDFGPIYSCWHICQVLNSTSACILYYKTERKKQGELVINPPSPLTSVHDFQDYFARLAGFFLVEETVLSTTEGLISKQYLDEMWHHAQNKIATAMQTAISNCTTASMIRSVKTIIVTFNRVLQDHDYSIGRLVDVLLDIRERYQSVLLTSSGEVLRGILFSDNYTPLHVDTEEEYRALRAKYPFSDVPADEAELPHSLEFSDAVPNIYVEVKQFIFLTWLYIHNIGLSNTEVDETVRQSTNQLLSKVLSGTMARIVRERTLTLPQLTQISVNTQYLERACEKLERYISSLTKTVGDDIHITRLYAASDFKDARSAAEYRMVELLSEQIDECLDLADYDWAPAEPRTTSSSYMYDLLAYLTTMFASLTNLPKEVATHAYFMTCKHLCSKLMELVQSPEIKKVNLNGIKSFELDVRLCEDYADSCPVIDAGDQLLQGLFVSLRELVDVFLKEDWAVYLDPEQRTQTYAHLKPHIVLMWLEKFDDTSRQGLFRSGEDRRKARLVDNALKKLRAEIGQQSHAQQSSS